MELLQKLIGECDHRAALYQSMPGLPKSMEEYNTQAVRAGKEPLKRILFVMDEASSILTAAGGGSGEIASRLAQLAWRGRKFGLSTVFGAQEFTKSTARAGARSNQPDPRLPRSSSAAQMARIVGCEGAERIPAGIPGRAILDQVGPLQVYYVPKSRLLAEHTSLIADSLTDLERQLFARSLNETDGRLPLGRIREWGNIPMHQARKLQECWALRGWIVKSAGQDNSFCITAKASGFARKPTNPANPSRPGANRRKPNHRQGEMKMTTKILALDPGYGNTKVCIDGTTAVLQSAIARPQSVGMAAIGMQTASRVQSIFLDGYEFTIGPGAWHWGTLAHQSRLFGAGIPRAPRPGVGHAGEGFGTWPI